MTIKIDLEEQGEDKPLIIINGETINLIKENKKLKEIISRAISFVESFEYYIPEDYKPELMDILRGTHE